MLHRRGFLHGFLGMGMYWIRRTCVLWLVIICAACGGLSGEPEIVRTVPPPPTDVPEAFAQLANIQAGAMIYSQNCASCHGLTGAGDGDLVRSGQVTNVPDFTDASSIEDKSLQAWFDVITDGRLEALMPPWRDALSASDRWAVAFYTYTLSYDQAVVAQGEMLYDANCAACHGQDGGGTTDGPALIGLLSSTETDLLHVLGIHPAEADIPLLAAEHEQQAVVQYLRLLSTTTRTLPGEVGPLVQPAATEEFAPEASPVIVQEVGTVRGRVIQGTPGGPSPAGLQAALHIFERQGDEQVVETIVGDDGGYQFDDVVIRSDMAYVVTVNSQDDVRFFSSIHIGHPTITEVNLDVTIYERTTDPAVIEIISHDFQVNLTPHGLYIIEVINLTNTSDQYVYVRDHDDFGVVSVSFPIAESVQLEPGHTDMERLLLSETGRELFDTEPVLPGAEHYVQFSYLLPTLNNTTLTLLPTEYHNQGPTEFYIDFNHLTLRGGGIEHSRNEEFGSDVYRVYTVTEVPQPGQAANFQLLVATSGPPFPEGNPDYALAGFLVISGVILLAAALLSHRHQRRRAVVAGDPTREDLIAQIAQLDNQFAAGTIDAVDYEKQRNMLKMRLAPKMKPDDSIKAEDQ
jgi:mono/diheme cytochrome c family protein